jgi:hypothetical protein
LHTPCTLTALRSIDGRSTLYCALSLLQVLPELAAQLTGAAAGTAGKLLAAFMADDVAGSGGGGGGSPSKPSRRSMKGDELEFTICRVNGVPLTAYSRGTQCKVVRTKRERLLAEQVSLSAPTPP